MRSRLNGTQLFVVVALLWLALSHSVNAQDRHEKGVVKTTICEVVSNPGLFEGKVIEVHAAVLAGLETNVLYDKRCLQGQFPARILFVSDEQTFKRTSDYRKFWNLVQAHREAKGTRRSIMPDKYTVTATFIGRFAVVGTTGQLITSHGMLTVKSVREVVAHPFDETFLPDAKSYPSESGRP